MPYITQEDRDFLDKEITALAKKIKQGHNYNIAGAINYSLTKLMLEVYEIKENPRYWKFNEIAGIFSCCDKEFYRTFVAPYEEQKKFDNGEV